MAKLPTYEEMAKDIAERALDTEYKGKTLREWIEQIASKQSENVVELPCKVGDTVYYIYGGYYKEAKYCKVSRPCKVVEISFKLSRKRNTVLEGFITDNGTRYSFDGIGKTVFLTKEEAEQALAKMKGGAER